VRVEPMNGRCIATENLNTKGTIAARDPTTGLLMTNSQSFSRDGAPELRYASHCGSLATTGSISP